ncbi:MAG: argininosuccinate lyase [Candidatus Bathyarchaeia archaeon]
MSWIGLREGRLRAKFDERASDYIYSRRLREQAELFETHIWIHKAHVVMLAEQGAIPPSQAKRILRALREIRPEDVELDTRRGGLYINTERYLIESIGEVASAMHTGRSRNDLSATSSRMVAREKVERVLERACSLQSTLIERAKEHLNTIMAGYTHLQQAQPITFAHWLMAYHDLLKHDIERLEDALKRTNLSTLGAAALAGTGHSIDRSRTAELLGFDGVLQNSLQCVTSRDYLLDLIFDLTMMMNTLDRMHEDIYLWTTNEFGMVELDDAFAGTSSIMPQKKNPLIQETVRARTATQMGRLTAALAVFKDLPMGHNFDAYEASLIFNDSVEEVSETLEITMRVISTLKVNRERMEENLRKGFIVATELADVMVRSAGVPFRAAHQIVSRVVRRALSQGLGGPDITLEMIQEASREVLDRELDLTEEDVRDAVDPRVNVERRRSVGGPAPTEVSRMIEERRRELRSTMERRTGRLEKYDAAKKKVELAIDRLLGEGG